MAAKPRVHDQPIAITLLGKLTIRAPSAPGVLRVPLRVQELLAYLLLHRDREFRRAHLAEVLWGARRGAQSRKYLRQALWMLRSGIERLAPDQTLLRAQGEWVRATVDPGVWVDVLALDRASHSVPAGHDVPLSEDLVNTLREGARLYVGDLLEGWDQEWCEGPREHMRRRYLVILDALVDHFESAADPDRTNHYAARALEVDPARESAHRAIMRTLYHAGDRSGAMRQYQQCREALRDELGADPDARTEAIREQILKGG